MKEWQILLRQLDTLMPRTTWYTAHFTVSNTNTILTLKQESLFVGLPARYQGIHQNGGLVCGVTIRFILYDHRQ